MPMAFLGISGIIQLHRIGVTVGIGGLISKNPVIWKEFFPACKPKGLKYRQIGQDLLLY
jgi:hypothetical protein